MQRAKLGPLFHRDLQTFKNIDELEGYQKKRALSSEDFLAVVFECGSMHHCP
jgi:hypothetical protein